MANSNKIQAFEESKVPIFGASRYKVGTDHAVWRRTYARSVAFRIGIGGDEISDTTVDYLMSNVAQVVRDVVMAAAHFSAHGRRTRVEARDLENAVNILGSLLPFTSSHAASNTQFSLSDALSKTIYPQNRYMVDLRSIMNMPPRRMPFKRRFRKHWLVIEGEQPRVPENPVIKPSTCNSVKEGVTAYQGSSADSLMEDVNRVPRVVNKLEQPVARPITTHMLSVDQQVFFKKCVETVISSSSEKRRASFCANTIFFYSGEPYPGLQSLVPRFALIIFEGVRCNIAEQNLPILKNILRLLKTLIDNPQVNLDKCLNEIIPALCSCVVCREFCTDPNDKRHFRLREFAAMILATICKRTHLADVRARVTTFLCRVFTDSRTNLSSLYGSLYALGELGCETVAVVVFPRLELLRRRITILNESGSAANSDGNRVIRLIEKMLTRFVRRRKMPGLNELSDYEKAFPGFGEAVYKKMKVAGHQEEDGQSESDIYQKSLGDSSSISSAGKIQNIPQKRYPRLSQLPMRAPGMIRPTHVSVAKLRMFKQSKRHAGSGIFSQTPVPPAARAAAASAPEFSQQLGGAQKAQQHGNVVAQDVRNTTVIPSTGPLPAVVVEPAFPRRRPPIAGEPAKTHPAVTVVPAYPRRPSQQGPQQ
ncbi:hypothetical protein DICVIV_09513 [Dictyocaulus viviparus]|uniref:TAF6 C-terminal HEAT repeat domain-containing protein n=1 Tax=Dictyocaulus viviparus TaxID=29172 RepID=A0A0D8XKU8_DICVI|nr:hypothetical protein DICVIV_09513 [Dictyocaulus viviparus]